MGEFSVNVGCMQCERSLLSLLALAIRQQYFCDLVPPHNKPIRKIKHTGKNIFGMLASILAQGIPSSSTLLCVLWFDSTLNRLSVVAH